MMNVDIIVNLSELETMYSRTTIIGKTKKNLPMITYHTHDQSQKPESDNPAASSAEVKWGLDIVTFYDMLVP